MNAFEDCTQCPLPPERYDYVGALAKAVAAPKRLLFVDDSPNDLDLFRHYVVNYHCILDEAPGDPEASRLVLANSYDLILIDIVMPGTCGIDLYQKIKNLKLGQGIRQRIVLISGAFNDALLARMQKLGCVIFVHKGNFCEDTIDEMLGVFGIEKKQQLTTN